MSSLPYLDKSIVNVGRESHKKVIFFGGPATNRGGGKNLATKKKQLFLKLEGFFAASLVYFH